MNKLKNYIGIVFDRSSSMAGLTSEANRALQSFVAEYKKLTEESGQETSLSLLSFSDYNSIRFEFFNKNILELDEVPHISMYGNTALRDGVGRMVTELARVKDADDRNTSFLIYVITDGFENDSHMYTSENIKELLRVKQGTDRWSFAFQVPHGYKQNIIYEFGVPEGNIREWEQTIHGTEVMASTNVASGRVFYACRAAGLTKSDSLYSMTTDLSDLSTSTVKRELTDISNDFLTIPVTKEVEIRDLVEDKTKKKYVKGSVYYQLTKTEIVQPSKDVLIMEKGKKAIWGGDEARELIGLPLDKKARVSPGNHGMYDVFVTSTSVNRKLVRGTKVLVNKNKLTTKVLNAIH